MIKQLLSLILLLAFAFTAAATETTLDSLAVAVPLREVSVTAIKQAPQLDSQPVAATTVTEETLERLNVTSFQDVSGLVPNFYMPSYGSRITSSMYIRGLGARIDQPAMGLNVDNIPVLNKNDYDVDLFDLERIEVLRGPQSVLYGRNTMGGVINVYTISPMHYQGLRLLGEWSSFNTWRTAVGVYHKFHPNFGIGLDLHAFNTAGQNDNLNTLSKYPEQKRRADQAEQYNAKLKLAWTPRADLEIDNVLSFSYNRQGGYPYELYETREINYNDTCYYNRTGVSDGLTIQYRGDGFTFSSITGLRYMDDDLQLDNDFTPKSFFTLSQKTKEYSLTQDFIFRGAKGNYGWMAGAFGFVKHATVDAPVTFGSDGIQELILSQLPAMLQPQWASSSFELGSDFVLPTWGLALYHESSYSLGRWHLAAALRLDYEHSAMIYNNDVSTGMSVMGMYFPAEIHNHDRLNQSFVQLLPRVTVSYDLPMESRSSVYASVSKGYKSGGYNTQMFSTILQEELMGTLMQYMPGGSAPAESDVSAETSYKPEYSWNYEIGAHVSCMQGRIHTDVDFFYMDIRDQQLTVFPDGQTTGRMMTNAGRTRSFGAELAITALPTDRWTARLSYGYTNARFLRYKDGNEDYRGKTVPYAPAHTLFSSVQYRQPLPMWWFNALSVELNGRGVGPIYWDEKNTVRQNFYALLGASVRLDFSRVSLDLWGENILNTRYNTFYFKSMGNAFVQRGSHRTFGVTLRYTM